MGFWEKIVSDKELSSIKKRRSQKDIFKKIPKADIDEAQRDGWEISRVLKKEFIIKKPKPIDERFEDEVWLLFANLGFQYMNKDRDFSIQYVPDSVASSHQIDVFAVDDETAIVVECKASDSPKKGNFKETIEAIVGIRTGLVGEIRKQYPDRKVKFILATKNYQLSPNDYIRLKDQNDILYFDENTIHYYRDLAKHLGACARYQLLGNLYAGQTIPNLDCTVPAIKGEMGGHDYYSFSIEPEKLLKIGYVLHSANSSDDTLPAYQRIIKKERLSEVREFVDNGGFFPNSLIINIDSKSPRFEQVSPKFSSVRSKAGILHLPQEYRSAYIIDGQHRLYGYTGSKYASTNTVPVVAFYDLSREEQVNLFMQINEHQKSVPKNLRLTLKADVYSSSKKASEQRIGLQLRIAIRLGEDQRSPLQNRIIIGEDESSPVRCLTIDYIQNALDSSNFFSKFEKDNTTKQHGTFDKGKIQAILDVFFPFIINCLNFISTELPEEWNKGKSDNGILTINMGIYSIIRVIGDIVDYLTNVTHDIRPITDRPEIVSDAVIPYLKPVIEFYKTVSPKQKEELRRKRGSGGMKDYWRTLQQVVHNAFPYFSPDGLQEWIKLNMRVYNKETQYYIRELAQQIKQDVRSRLESYFGDTWFTQGLPQATYAHLNKQSSTFNYKNSDVPKEPWDFVSLKDCHNIIVKSGNWKEIFEPFYVIPQEVGMRANKGQKTIWLKELAMLEQSDFEICTISDEQYSKVKEIYNWRCNKEHQPHSQTSPPLSTI